MPKFGVFKFGIEKFGDYYPATIYSSAAKYLIGGGTFTSQLITHTHGYATTTITGKDMLPNQSMKDAIKSSISNYELKLYIQDNNYNWIDFSERANINGRNQLRKIGSISYSSESIQGEVRQRASSLTLDDSDGFWREPLPGTLYASYDENWNWLGMESTQAEFGDSYNKTMNILYRHKICIKANYFALGTDIPQEITLGVFLIDRTRCNQSAGSFDITMTSLDYPLVEQDASIVKDGADWYQNRPVSFLVQELLKTVYRDSSGALPVDYDIDDIVSYDVPDVDNTGWAISHAGRPPEKIYERDASSGWESSSSWNKKYNNLPKSITAQEITTGLLDITAGSKTVSVSNYGDLSTLSAANTIVAGDTLTIPRSYSSGDGGSSTSFGHYTVASIDTSEQTITLTEAVRGHDDEVNLRWAVVRVFIGVGSELFLYNQAEDSYYKVTNDTTEKLDESYSIFRLWYNENDATWPIYGVAIQDFNRFYTGTGAYYTDAGDNMQVFRAKITSSGATFEKVGVEIEKVLTGEFHKEDVQRGHVGDTNYMLHYYAGHFNGDVVNSGTVYEGRFPIPMIFDQHLSSRYNKSMDCVFMSGDNADEVTASDLTQKEDSSKYYDGGTSSSWCRRGLYSAWWETYVSNYPGGVRWSYGQKGFLLFSSHENKIVFCKHYTVSTAFPDATYDSYSDTGGRYYYKFYTMDLGDPAFTVAEIAVTGSWVAGTEMGMPICGAANPYGSEFYVGCVTKSFDGTSVPFVQNTYKIYIAGSSSLVSSDVTYGIPIEYAMIGKDASNVYLHGIFVIWDADTSGQGLTDVKYMLTAYDSSGTLFPQLSTSSTSELHGLSYMKLYNSTLAAWEDKCFYFESQAQRLRALDTPSLVAGTYPTNTIIEYSGIMSDEPYAISNICSMQTTMQLLWMSSPLPNFTNSALAEGRFSLNQWSYNVFARVDLADFTDMKVWSVIGYLADKVDAIYGFYPDGNFFFKRRPKNLYSEHTFTNVGDNQINNIIMENGYGEIVNAAVRSPSRIGIPPVEVVWELSPNSKYDEDGYRHNIDISRGSLSSRMIKLICTQGGKISTGLNSTTGAPENVQAKFKFEVIDSEITSVLLASVSTSSSLLLLDGEFQMLYGSSVRIEGRDQNQVADSAETIDTVWGTGKIGYRLQQSSLDVVLANDIDATTQVVELELLGGTTSVDMSNSFGNGQTMAIGTEIVIGDLDNGSNFEYCQVVDFTATKLTIQRSSIPNRGQRINHDAGENIALISNGNAYFLRYNGTDFTENYTTIPSTLFEIGDRVTISLPTMGVSTSKPDNPNSSSDTGTSTQAEFIPVDDVYMPIGGANNSISTGVRAKFTFPGSSSHEPDFGVGDIIRINAPGLTLANDATITHNYSDMGSIAIYSKRDARGDTNNPFLTDDDARWIVRRLVNDNRFPKHTLRIMCVAMPWLIPGKVCTLQSPEMLPRMVEHKEEFYISQASFNLQYDGLMEIVGRGIKPY